MKNIKWDYCRIKGELLSYDKKEGTAIVRLYGNNELGLEVDMSSWRIDAIKNAFFKNKNVDLSVISQDENGAMNTILLKVVQR